MARRALTLEMRSSVVVQLTWRLVGQDASSWLHSDQLFGVIDLLLLALDVLDVLVMDVVDLEDLLSHVVVVVVLIGDDL